jgi:hypothetical protein
MAGKILVEIIGLKNSECSPFPCDAERTCGLVGCYPKGTLAASFEEVKKVLHEDYGDTVDCSLTLIDDNVPAHIIKILETDYPPIPMVLVNGRLTRIGRIVLDRIKDEIEKER